VSFGFIKAAYGMGSGLKKNDEESHRDMIDSKMMKNHIVPRLLVVQHDA
jgi:hypothetical protein